MPVALPQKQFKVMASRQLQLYISTACHNSALDMDGKL
jgi:hypothetical protein